MNILFRVDASNIIGTGHVYRCLNFADLYSKNNNIYFITKKHLFNLNEKIKEKYTCFELEIENIDNINLNIDTWLGESELNDVKKTISVIEKNKLEIDWIIIDHYGINEVWENEIKKYVKKICVIDDFINRKHNCNILINQQIREEEKIKYKDIINKECKICVGNDYLILNSKYYEMEIKKEIKNLRRINIFMGGSDNDNITNEIIDICNEFIIKNELNIIVDVIIGKSNKNFKKIENKLNNLKNFNYYYDIKFIGNLLLEADLAIGSPGTTSYERVITCTPSLMICIAYNQKTVIKKFIESGTSKYIGEIDDKENDYKKELKRNLNEINKNYEELINMSNRCKKFINLKENKIKLILDKVF